MKRAAKKALDYVNDAAVDKLAKVSVLTGGVPAMLGDPEGWTRGFAQTAVDAISAQGGLSPRVVINLVAWLAPKVYGRIMAKLKGRNPPTKSAETTPDRANAEATQELLRVTLEAVCAGLGLDPAQVEKLLPSVEEIMAK